ncbi:MAG TPA: ribonuclease HII [Epulopiscium sp.]|nr:ribonuclease HII [Candidatus Epulonipiscium sp.]
MTIKEVKQYFDFQPMASIPSAMKKFQEDPRQGVQQICSQYQRRYEKYSQELLRVETMREFDQVFGNNGEYIVAGIDEAGRGPLAGPVVAAAVVLPHDLTFEGIDDSKKLTPSQRDILYDQIMDKAISVGVGIVSADVIDDINILQATFRAMKKAVFSMEQSADILLVDGNLTIPEVNLAMTQHAVIQGDAKSISIAAASIIAKVTRDRMMIDYHYVYPWYDFIYNKGYGSMVHQSAIQQFGPSPIHRMSFLKNILR